MLNQCKASDPRFLIITPINKKKNSNSNIDYNEQLNRVIAGEHSWCWDDSRFNTANVGEFFGFFLYNKKVVIHVIKDIKDPVDRLPSWSKNVGQRNRRVLELSNPMVEIEWQEWIALGGAKRSMGTFRTQNMEKKNTLLFNYLRDLSMKK